MWEKLKQLARRYDEIGELLEVTEIYAHARAEGALRRGRGLSRVPEV